MPTQRAASWTGGVDQASGSKSIPTIAESQTSSTLAGGEEEEQEESPSGLYGDMPVTSLADAGLASPPLSGLAWPEPIILAGAEHTDSCKHVKLDTETPAQSSPVNKETIFSEASQQTIIKKDAAPAPVVTDTASLAHAGSSHSVDAALLTSEAADSSASVALHASPSPLIGNKLTSVPAAFGEKPAEQSNLLFQMPQETQGNIFASAQGGHSIAGLGMEVLAAMGGLQAAEGRTIEALRESQGSNPGPAPEEDGILPVLESKAPEMAQLLSEGDAYSPLQSRASEIGLALLADSQDGAVSSAETLPKLSRPESPSALFQEEQDLAQSIDDSAGKCPSILLQFHRVYALGHVHMMKSSQGKTCILRLLCSDVMQGLTIVV